MKKQKISLLGSTGSIGKNVLDIVQKFPNKFEIEALGAAGNDMDLFAKQINQFLPKIVCLADEKKIIALQKKLHKKTEIVSGTRGSCILASFPSSDFFVSAIVGAAGLSPTISAINAQKTIALANKETLVMAGDYIMDLAKKKNVRILPIDSEHSAIFQCLEKNNKKSIKKIFLTASGGPFLHREKNISLFSLESKKEVKSFDIIGFSLLYELNYTNVLLMLELSKIPFFCKRQKRNSPNHYSRRSILF